MFYEISFTVNLNIFFLFREFFVKLDGATSGPKSFKGLIGNLIASDDLDEKPFVEFKQINCDIDIPDEIHKDLSTDQAQLYSYCKFISTGVKDNVVTWKLGKLCHARCLTMATRILALYSKTVKIQLKNSNH